MFSFIFILLPNLLAKDLPETKHIRGGVFGWVNALCLQRKIWGFLPIPMISFNSSEISLSDITKEFIAGQFDMNLSEIIQDMLGSLFNETEEDNYTDDNYYDESSYEIQYSNLMQMLKVFSSKPLNHDDVYKYNQDSDNSWNNPSYDPSDSGEEENKPKNFCDKDSFPNAHLISNMFDGELDFDCETVNNIMGQFFSYTFIIVPLLIIFVITILFYIVFCFGRCCCCCAKKRVKPGKAAIIFFVIITVYLLITIAFSFTASVYLVKIVNYIFKKDVMKDAETVCQMIDPSINSGVRQVVDKLVPSIESISNESVTAIDMSLPQLMGILNATQDNLTLLMEIMKDLQSYGNTSQNDIQTRESTFNQCAANVNSNPSRTCQNNEINEINLFKEFSDFNKTGDTNDQINSSINEISNVMNVSSFIDESKEMITSSFGGISDTLRELDNISISKKCDFSNYFEIIDDLPSFIVPVAGVVLFLIPAIMLIILLIQICVFWTKGCCSRCCAACCVPCCVCAFCQLIIGLMATFILLFVVFINLFYSQGDDVFDTLIKEFTNEDRSIDFGSLNLSSVTDNVIGSFPLSTIKLNKIEFVKNFIDAKLDTPLSHIISLDQMPFEEIADMLESSLTNAANSTNLDEMIVNPIRDTINESKSSMPDIELNEVANVSEMKSQLNNFQVVVDRCYEPCKTQFSHLNDCYNDFFIKFDEKAENYKKTRKEVDVVLDGVPDQVDVYGNDVFGGLLKTMGKSFASTLRLIVPVLNEIDVKFVIGAFNIIRVNFMHSFFMSVACMSIAAHLYMVGMMAMTILLWVRRKGMAKENQNGEEEDDDEDDYSLSFTDKNNNDEDDNNNQNVNQNQNPPTTAPPQIQKRPILFGRRKQKVENDYDLGDGGHPSTASSKRSKRKQQVENSSSDDL